MSGKRIKAEYDEYHLKTKNVCVFIFDPLPTFIPSHPHNHLNYYYHYPHQLGGSGEAVKCKDKCAGWNINVNFAYFKKSGDKKCYCYIIPGELLLCLSLYFIICVNGTSVLVMGFSSYWHPNTNNIFGFCREKTNFDALVATLSCKFNAY